MNEQPFNQLTPAELERLALLSEELGEAQQAIGKIMRHGYESYHPDAPAGPRNRDRLESELGDVMAAVNMMCDAGDLSGVSMRIYAEQKRERVKKYLHHQ